MVHGYVSIKQVIGKLYRDLGLTTEINEAHIIEWIAEALSMIGTYSQYEQSKTCLEVDDQGRSMLPLNFYRIVDIAYQGRALSWASNNLIDNYGCEGCTITTCCSEHTFYINDCYIITNIKPTDPDPNNPKLLCISYLGVPVDEEGYPKVPDDVYFLKACAAYVTQQLDYRDWRKGNLPDKVFQKSEQEWLFYVAAAKGSGNMPSTAQLENLKNVWVRMIPKQNEFNNFFSNNSKQERRYRY